MLAIRFLDGPGNLSVLAKVRKIIGVFTFLAPVHPHQNQFPPPYGVASHKIP